MKWLPPWLGAAYAQLAAPSEPTSIPQASKTLNLPVAKAKLILSRLHAYGWVERPGRGLYRPKSPEKVMETFRLESCISNQLGAGSLSSFIGALAEAVLDIYGPRLEGMVVYGSAARGSFTPGRSDVDVLLVIRELAANVSERVEEFLEVYERLRRSHEYTRWFRAGLTPPLVEPYILEPQELYHPHRILPDICVEGVVLYDPHGLVEARIKEVRKNLAKAKARRVLVKGRPLWVLNRAAKGPGF